MPRMEIEIVRQATCRTHRLAIPRAHRLRRTDRCEGFQQRSGQQGQTDPPLQRRCRPRPRPLHGGGILGHKEVRLHRPPMPVAYPTLLARQLICRGAHEQRRVVGGIINPHHIQPDGGALLIVQRLPAPEPDVPGLPRHVRSTSGATSGRSRPGWKTSPCRGGRPGLPWAVRTRRSLGLMRRRPSRASCAVAAANCSLVAMPASTTSSRFPGAGGSSRRRAPPLLDSWGQSGCGALAPRAPHESSRPRSGRPQCWPARPGQPGDNRLCRPTPSAGPPAGGQ